MRYCSCAGRDVTAHLQGAGAPSFSRLEVIGACRMESDFCATLSSLVQAPGCPAWQQRALAMEGRQVSGGPRLGSGHQTVVVGGDPVYLIEVLHGAGLIFSFKDGHSYSRFCTNLRLCRPSRSSTLTSGRTAEISPLPAKLRRPCAAQSRPCRRR